LELGSGGLIFVYADKASCNLDSYPNSYVEDNR
jgi:hypothetical protein